MVKDAIVGSLTNLGQTIINGLQNVIEFLFVPSNNLFNEVEEMFNEKFGIFYQVSDIVKSFSFTDDTKKPNFNITLYGSTMSFIDFGMFDTYRSYVHNIIVMIAYFKFIMWLVNNAPAIVTGTGGSLSDKGGSAA